MALVRPAASIARCRGALALMMPCTGGWTNKQTLISHVDSHLAGTLQAKSLHNDSATTTGNAAQCGGLSVSTRYGVHPTCQPAARAALAASPNQFRHWA